MEEFKINNTSNANDSSSEDYSEYPESFPDDNTPEDYPAHHEGSKENCGVASSQRDIAVPIGRTKIEESNSNRTNAAVSDSPSSEHGSMMGSEGNQASNYNTKTELKNEVLKGAYENCEPINVFATEDDRCLEFSPSKLHNQSAVSKEYWSCEETTGSFRVGSTRGVASNKLADNRFDDYELSSSNTLTPNVEWSDSIRNIDSHILPSFEESFTSSVRDTKLQNIARVYQSLISQQMRLKRLLRVRPKDVSSCEQKTTNPSMEASGLSKQYSYVATCSAKYKAHISATLEHEKRECPAGYCVENAARTRSSSTMSELSADHCSKPRIPRTSEYTFAIKHPLRETCEFRPFVSALFIDKMKSYCSYCFRKLNLGKRLEFLKCDICEICHYCSEYCEARYYSTHRRECSLLQKARHNLPSAFIRALAHGYWKFEQFRSGVIDHTVTDQIFRFHSVEPYQVELLELEQYQESLNLHFQDLKRFLQGKIKISQGGFEVLYTKFLKYQMPIFNHEGYLGIGMYLQLSNFAYSCPPKGSAAFLGNIMQVMAQEYRLSEDEENRWNTNDLNNAVEKAIGIATNLKDIIRDGGKKPEDICGYLKKMATLLGCFNYLNIEVLESVGESCKRLNYLDEALYCYQQLKAVYEVLFGARNAKTIEVTYQLGLLLGEAERLKEAEVFLSEAMESACGSYGVGHAYTEEIRQHLAVK